MENKRKRLFKDAATFIMTAVMFKKVTVISLVSIFAFILTMTAWDYCGPQPQQPRLETKAALAQFNQIKFKKAHHPCASLRSPYDLVSSFRVFGQEIFQAFRSLLSLSGKYFVFKDYSVANDLSPPLAHSPPQTIPIFQLNSNLRI